MPANVKVSIPVEVGGFTGQRDAWEATERDHEVALFGEFVLLKSHSGARRLVKFKLADFEEALAFIRGTK